MPQTDANGFQIVGSSAPPSGGASSSAPSLDSNGFQIVGGSSPSPVSGNPTPPPDTSNPDDPWYKKAWNFANTPLTESFGIPSERQGAGGFERAGEHILAGLTSPLSLALTAATFGTGGFIESAGASALKEAGLSAADIANASKASEVALNAARDLKPVEPAIQEALTAGGHDIGLVDRAREALGPVNLEDSFGEKEVQDALRKKGFTDPQLEDLGKSSKAIQKAKAEFSPVDDAVRDAGLDVDKWKQAQDTLRKNGLDENDLIGGNALERGAFQIIRKTIPDLPVAASAKIAKTANAVLNAGFTLQQFESAAALSPRFLDALKEGDSDKAWEYGTEALVGGALGLAGAPHALHAAGELFDPLLEPGNKLRPSDQTLAYNRAHQEREALQEVGSAQARQVDGQIRDALGHTSKTDAAQKQLDLATVFHSVVTGGDANKAAAWHNALAEAAGKDARVPMSSENYSKAVVNSPEFKQWFQDSQVVDENGAPKQVYHGTNRAGFDSFKKDVLNPNSLYGSGVYTTEEPSIASDYAQTSNIRGSYDREDMRKYFTPGRIVDGYGGKDKVLDFKEDDPYKGAWSVKVQRVDKNGNPVSGEAPRWHSTMPEVENVNKALGGSQAVYPLRASIQNPFDADSEFTEAQAKKIFGKYNKTGWLDRLFEDHAHFNQDTVSGRNLYGRAQVALDDYHDQSSLDGFGEPHREPDLPSNDAQSPQDQVNHLLQEAGYDGITHTGGKNTGGDPHKVWIAFDPKQVKPAYDAFGVDPNRPTNGLPENVADQIASSKFKSQPEAYQKLVLDSLKKVATGDLSEKVKAATQIARDEQAKNFEIGSANDLLHAHIEDYMTRVYKDANEPGKVIASEAKTGRFATNVTMARQRVYDSHITALLKSPKEMYFDAAANVAQGRDSLIKAAANKQFIDTLRDKFTRASDGRPAVVLSGSGQVVHGPEGEDPATYIQPDRVRKIQVADEVVKHLQQTGDLYRYIDDGSLKEITPKVYPDTLDTAISKLNERIERIADPHQLDETKKQLDTLQQAKALKGQAQADAITDYNSKLKPMYAWDPQDYIKLDNAALKGWNFVTNDTSGNGVFVRSDIKVHPEFAENLQNRLGLEQSSLAKHPVSAAILKANTKLKETLLSLSPFHMAQLALRGVMVGVNPFTLNTPDILNGEKIDPSDPNSPSIIRKAVEHGLTTGTDYKAEQQMSEGVSSGAGLLRKIPGVGKTIANSLDWYQDFLFKRFMPALKANAAEKLFRDYQTTHPDWSVDRVAKATALHTNDTFGGINWKAMGRSATTQDWGRLLLLAPDWMESEMNSMGRLFNKDEGSLGRAQVAKMAMGLWGIARVLNYANTGNFHNEAPFGLAVKNKDGKEIVYSMRTLPTDMLHAAADPANFIKGRLSPNLGIAQELMTSRDRYGRKLGPEDLYADIFRNMAPIPLQAIGQAVSGTGPEVGTPAQVVKALGGTAQTYQTPAQKMAADLASTHSEDGVVDPALQARHRMVMNLEDKVRSGEMPMQDLMRLTYQTDQLKESELKKIQDNYKKTQGMSADTASLYSRASRLPAKEYLDLLDVANPSEKVALIPLTLQTQKKYLTKAKKDETPQERAKDPVFQRFLNMTIQQPEKK